MPATPTDGLPAGIRLEPNGLGGLAVYHRGIYIGWIHDRHGGMWSAYRRGDGVTGIPLGTHTKAEAIRQISATRATPSGGPPRDGGG